MKKVQPKSHLMVENKHFLLKIVKNIRMFPFNIALEVQCNLANKRTIRQKLEKQK